jgi:hypothetical protein
MCTGDIMTKARHNGRNCGTMGVLYFISFVDGL